ncbi:hypothetical protein PoB_002731000 [Plakobranchus ocellatus]|uniref:Uncharacterized protein n=1 Tax=Plakobranchus ocellatus TaxID=259542 RepID=A0AAV3ZY57_9GAST|nr:hypothetical protein PoB_002731000 [Plakobranchus ocellatus]
MVPSPRIDFNSLWILKGDLSATFIVPFELITVIFLNDDQPAKGDTLIKVGRTSAFFLLATETASRAGHVACHSSAVSGLPWSYTPSRECGTSTGIDPSPIQRKMTSQLGSVGHAALPSQEKEGAKEAR